MTYISRVLLKQGFFLFDLSAHKKSILINNFLKNLYELTFRAMLSFDDNSQIDFD